MLELPSVTLLCADCVYIDRAVEIMNRCTSVCNFGAVKLLTHLETDYPHKVAIDKLPSLVDYSIFMVKRAVDFVNTKHVLVVQHDGFIINVDMWDPKWLEYDYIAPLFVQNFPQNQMVGSGGFSLRTKALMEFVKKRIPEWDGTPASTERVQKFLGRYEDGVICHWLRADLESSGFKFAPPLAASRFAQGGFPNRYSHKPEDRTYYTERPWGFHGGWTNVDRKTGLVIPPPFE